VFSLYFHGEWQGRMIIDQLMPALGIQKGNWDRRKWCCSGHTARVDFLTVVTIKLESTYCAGFGAEIVSPLRPIGSDPFELMKIDVRKMVAPHETRRQPFLI
jgi:hypothetical protein